MEKKILLIPTIYMIISAVCFGSDLYFFISHEENIEDLQNNNGGIIFMHFLIVRLLNNVMSMCTYECGGFGTSRLTIVSREAKKKQAVRDE